MVIVQKKFRGQDGKTRTWLIDTDDNYLQYQGYAHDFIEYKNEIEDKTMSAQDLIDTCEDRFI